MNKEEEQILVRALKNQEESAYETLITLYGHRLYRSCLLLTSDEREAEDILQDTLIKVVRHIRSFRRESSLYTWIYRIALREVQDRWRKRHPQYSVDDLSEQEDGMNVEEEFFRQEEIERVREAIHTLPNHHRQVIVMFYYEKFSIAEIAKFLSVSENTVKSRLHRARRLIRIQLEQEGGEHIE